MSSIFGGVYDGEVLVVNGAKPRNHDMFHVSKRKSRRRLAGVMLGFIAVTTTGAALMNGVSGTIGESLVRIKEPPPLPLAAPRRRARSRSSAPRWPCVTTRSALESTRSLPPALHSRASAAPWAGVVQPLLFGPVVRVGVR